MIVDHHLSMWLAGNHFLRLQFVFYLHPWLLCRSWRSASVIGSDTKWGSRRGCLVARAWEVRGLRPVLMSIRISRWRKGLGQTSSLEYSWTDCLWCPCLALCSIVILSWPAAARSVDFILLDQMPVPVIRLVVVASCTGHSTESRQGHDDTNMVKKRGWSQSKMEEGNEELTGVPNIVGFVRCLIPEFQEIWRPNVSLQQTSHGCPETVVLVRQEIPRRICPWMLRDWGLVQRTSRNLSDAIVAIRKHPNVRISAGCESSESIRSSQAANTAMGMGVASDLSNGMRVLDFKKSETVWLCNAGRIGKLNQVSEQSNRELWRALSSWFWMVGSSFSSWSSLKHEGSPVPKIMVLRLEDQHAQWRQTCRYISRPPVPRLSAIRSICWSRNSELWISQKSLPEKPIPWKISLSWNFALSESMVSLSSVDCKVFVVWWNLAGDGRDFAVAWSNSNRCGGSTAWSGWLEVAKQCKAGACNPPNWSCGSFDFGRNLGGGKA